MRDFSKENVNFSRDKEEREVRRN